MSIAHFKHVRPESANLVRLDQDGFTKLLALNKQALSFGPILFKMEQAELLAVLHLIKPGPNIKWAYILDPGLTQVLKPKAQSQPKMAHARPY